MSNTSSSPYFSNRTFISPNIGVIVKTYHREHIILAFSLAHKKSISSGRDGRGPIQLKHNNWPLFAAQNVYMYIPISEESRPTSNASVTIGFFDLWRGREKKFECGPSGRAAPAIPNHFSPIVKKFVLEYRFWKLFRTVRGCRKVISLVILRHSPSSESSRWSPSHWHWPERSGLSIENVEDSRKQIDNPFLGCNCVHRNHSVRRCALISGAIHYSWSTTKPGWNESFAEKIVSSRNTTKTMLHTIRWSSKVSRLSLTSSVCAKNHFKFVIKIARRAKQDEPSFVKKCFT